jgi:ABC-type phosphate transport system auxiliary subunit
MGFFDNKKKEKTIKMTESEHSAIIEKLEKLRLFEEKAELQNRLNEAEKKLSEKKGEEKK